MITVVYSREVAVKEGFRESAEINKEDFKRPVLIHLRADYEAKDFYKKREEMLNGVTKIEKNVVKRSFLNGSLILCTDKHSNKKLISAIWNTKKKIGLKEVIQLDNFKDRTIYVYIEKQDGSIYTARNIEGLNKDQVFDIKLDGLYDIAGRLVYINLDKKNGVYKVNQIVKAID